MKNSTGAQKKVISVIFGGAMLRDIEKIAEELDPMPNLSRAVRVLVFEALKTRKAANDQSKNSN